MWDTYTEITLRLEGKAAVITLNRPQVGNAFSLESYTQITSAVEELARDERVGAIVLTGAGKHFSAGGDINRFKMLIETKAYLDPRNVAAAGRMAATVRRCPKPVIAMVNGVAAGAGCSLALACDFRVVSPKSKFVMAFINMGLSGDTGGMYYLQKLVGTGRTVEMMMTGEPVAGEEAVRIGLASRLAPSPEELEACTMELAQKLAAKPLFAIGRQKQLMNETFYADLEAYTEHEVDYMTACSRSCDFAEAVYAFLEKRTPSFIGK